MQNSREVQAVEIHGQDTGTAKLSDFESVMAYLARRWKENAEHPAESLSEEYAEQHARFQCASFNEQKGNLGGAECPICRNKGYIMKPTGGWGTAMYECECMKQRRYSEGLERAGLRDAERFTFDTYTTEEEWQKKAKALAMRYVSEGGHNWLYIAGNSGAGKTHLCTAVCAQLVKAGKEVRYEVWSDVLHSLEQARFDDRKRGELMERLRGVDVLYLDDFLKTPANKRPSDSALAYALEIINARYVADRVTILSTEHLLGEICGFDEALGGRIAEKTPGSKIQMRGENRNYRMRDKR